MKTLPYGEWPSPISTDLIAGATRRLCQTALDGEAIYWTESRPWEAGRTVLVRWENGQQQDLTPAPFDVRSKVHEYGGGAFAVAGQRVWFVNAKDQCIYEIADDIVRLTAPSAQRFADLQFDAKRNRLIAICEDHSNEGQPDNFLASIDCSSGVVSTLARGADFYASPVLNADNTQLAWLEWQHPNLPWDCTTLFVADLEDELTQVRAIVDSPNQAVFQPQWAKDGALWFSSDADDWWNLYRFANNTITQITHETAECGLPLWNFSMSTAALTGADSALCLFSRAGRWEVQRWANGALEKLALPYSFFDQIRANTQHAVMIAGAPDRPTAVIRLDLHSGEMTALQRASDADIAPEFLSQPESVTFPTGNGELAHGLFYPPTNADYTAPDGEKPPLLVKCHGGPTAATSTAQELKIQFWTSRGFAVLDVNYRGSTGYGRAYRRRLYGEWGVVDVEDCLRGAEYFVTQNRVDGERLFISGSSAGGFTVLCALTFHHTFKAGASYYGIGDLRTILDETHKFECRYGDQLVGPYPEFADVYQARSPIFSPERLHCPVIFFQGLEDKIVPPNQAEMMAAVLREKGLPLAHLTFADEGHGFRQAATIKTTLCSELAFYGKLFGFSPADAPSHLVIENYSQVSGEDNAEK